MFGSCFKNTSISSSQICFRFWERKNPLNLVSLLTITDTSRIIKIKEWRILKCNPQFQVFILISSTFFQKKQLSWTKHLLRRLVPLTGLAVVTRARERERERESKLSSSKMFYEEVLHKEVRQSFVKRSDLTLCSLHLEEAQNECSATCDKNPRCTAAPVWLLCTLILRWAHLLLLSIFYSEVPVARKCKLFRVCGFAVCRPKAPLYKYSLINVPCKRRGYANRKPWFFSSQNFASSDSEHA